MSVKMEARSGWPRNKATPLIVESVGLVVAHSIPLDDRVARKQVGGREQIEGKKSEVTEDE